MGNVTLVTGEIRVEPPLNWAEIQRLPERLDAGRGVKADPDVKLRIEEKLVNRDDGKLIVYSASAIIPARSDRYKAYHVEGHLQQIVDLYPSHTFTGYLEGQGEVTGDDLDVWRLAVVNGKATTFRPELVWSEEVQDRPDLPF